MPGYVGKLIVVLWVPVWHAPRHDSTVYLGEVSRLDSFWLLTSVTNLLFRGGQALKLMSCVCRCIMGLVMIVVLGIVVVIIMHILKFPKGKSLIPGQILATVRTTPSSNNFGAKKSA